MVDARSYLRENIGDRTPALQSFPTKMITLQNDRKPAAGGKTYSTKIIDSKMIARGKVFFVPAK